MHAKRFPTDFARIETAAAQWLVRRGDADHTPEDDEEFYVWLEADPRHGDAYDALARTLEDVGALNELASIAPPRRRFWARPGAAAAIAAVALIAAIFVGAPLLQPLDSGFHTAIAETRTISLADGSQVTLGADSRISVRLGDDERRVVLEQGEAFFEVAHESARPFYVEAGGAVVRVIGTKFDVRRGVEGVQVSVQEGRVEVRDRRALTLTAPTIRVLTAGQRTEVQERPVYIALAAPPPPVERVTVVRPGAWRDGRLAYDNVRLGEVIADINRYYEPGVRIADEAADLRVTAAFGVDEIPAFLEALAAALPVSVARSQEGAYALNGRAS